MADLKEISELERAFFELKRIKKEIDNLYDFIAAALSTKDNRKPKNDYMIDPRSGEKFWTIYYNGAYPPT